MNTFTSKIAFLACALVLGSGALTNTVNAQISAPYGEISTLLVKEGNSALEAGDYNTALAKFERAMVADPQNVEVYVGLGNLYFEVKSYPLSLKYFDIALSLEPTSMPILELAAYSHLAAESPEAVEEIRKKMETICLAGGCEELERLNQALETEDPSLSPDDTDS